MKKLPIGIQNIHEILTQGYVYVDKTAFAQELIQNGKHYFLSRPRRFGKSLFLNTLKEILRGNKQLFKNCQIYHSDYEWKPYHVLTLDCASIDTKTSEDFTAGLEALINKLGHEHGIGVHGPSIQFQLQVLIKELAKEKPVVVLVDEYDNAIIDNLKKPEVAEQNRDILKGFFATLKSLDEYLKFTFTTGVSKFSQVSLFSGPNNLQDITMHPRYATMMGYTEEELRSAFDEHIQAIASERTSLGKHVSEEDILAEITQWYNGYRFSEEKAYVYNPFSTLNFMHRRKAISFWYSSGTPSFLMDLLKESPKVLTPLAGTSVLRTKLLDISRIDRIHIAALMFQTGYLTIQGYNDEEDSYQLDFPNQEVKQSFFNSLLDEIAEIEPLEVTRAAAQLRKDLSQYDLEAFVQTINIHFAKIPYHVFTHAKEGFYQAIFFTLLVKSGIEAQAEVATHRGRIDLMAPMSKTLFIFELKVDQSAAIAFEQARIKQYRERYLQADKELVVIGINFSTQSRDIATWQGSIYAADGSLVKEI